MGRAGSRAGLVRSLDRRAGHRDRNREVGAGLRARTLRTPGWLFAAYTSAIYCFSIHFNALFLVYCATLGASIFGIAMVGSEIRGEQTRFRDRPAGGFLVGIGSAFAVLWLAQIVPALLAGTSPAGVEELDLPTNPVHVLDLAIILPLHLVAGVGSWRGTRLGSLLAPPLLAFGALMAGSMSLLVVLGGGIAVAIVLAGVAVIEAGLLVRMWQRTSCASPSSISQGCRGTPHAA